MSAERDGSGLAGLAASDFNACVSKLASSCRVEARTTEPKGKY